MSDILIDDLPEDIYGDHICVIIPEGYEDFKLGSSYRPNGMGGMFKRKGSTKWETSWGIDIPDAEYAYGYNMNGHTWDAVTGASTEINIMIPYEVLIRHFKHVNAFTSNEEVQAFIKRVNRDIKIDDILDEK